jgi:hypothetical protein
MNTTAPNLMGATRTRLRSLWNHLRSGYQPARDGVGRLREQSGGDHRVWAEGMQARVRDLDDEAGLAAHWGRFPETLTDGRGNATHLRHC